MTTLYPPENLRLNTILTKWYLQKKRDLPWRNTRDPYAIWLSEIILQQTRVDQGYDYYMRFITQYPTVGSLADAHEDDVLKLWQGLGYYSRARNLHLTAKIIMSQFGGIFPTQHKDILSLKGVGEYTAAAIASFAYNDAYATVDGNVYRVLSRIFAIKDPIDTGSGKKVFAELADSLLNQQDPATHNQAIMEFGALQCTPASPDCGNCPASEMCLAYGEKNVTAYPVKQGKTKVTKRFFNYFDIRYGSNMYLHKRTGNDIWKNLYELPLIETDSTMSFDEIQKTEQFRALFEGNDKLRIKLIQQDVKHILSHRILYANFYQVKIEHALPEKDELVEINCDDLSKYAVSRLVDKYFEILG